LTDIKIDLSFLGPPPKASEREILWEYILKIMDRFYDDKEIWRRYGWALRLKKINPRKEMFDSVRTTFGGLGDERIKEMSEDIHELSRRLKNNGS